MQSTITLILVDGARVVVPDSLDLITPYVLQEQQDWFEDEIKFLRRLLRSGQKVIDIGANYGVYSLSMAQTVGPSGCVWAFEPASDTARLLAEGIAVNGFTQIVLEQSALSSASGTAQLSLNENSELNALVRGAPPTNASETVPVSTLDECLGRYDWRDIAFMKIDAEGEEANILKGGARFFAERSPLVQYEVKAGADWHMELAEQFAAFGYDSYRLVPGLDLLVPFATESAPDGYLLNLFCCKQDRARQLSADGFLLVSTGHVTTTGPERFPKIRERIERGNACNWRHTIAKLPYGAQLAQRWDRTMAAGKSSVEVDEALSLYVLSRDASLSSGERFGALEASFALLKVLCERQSAYLRLASLARVARDYGARSVAVRALQQLCNTILEHKPMDLGEPFLAPAERFDLLPPGASVGDWLLAAALEEFERLASFSSFYTGPTGRQRLEIIRTLGFGSAEMKRRSQLLQNRFG
jgi:FkbM family methyltransferase